MVSEVIRLVKEQIAATLVPVKTVFLVGGFGASNYLAEALQFSLGGIANVIQPPNCEEAVTHGSLLRAIAMEALRQPQ